jgi:hypothetical protein
LEIDPDHALTIVGIQRLWIFLPHKSTSLLDIKNPYHAKYSLSRKARERMRKLK